MVNTLDLHKKPCSSVFWWEATIIHWVVIIFLWVITIFRWPTTIFLLSANDISLSGNEISLTGNEISHPTRRNLATTGTIDVPEYRAIFRSKQNLVNIRRDIAIFGDFRRLSFSLILPNTVTYRQFLKVLRRQKWMLFVQCAEYVGFSNG